MAVAVLSMGSVLVMVKFKPLMVLVAALAAGCSSNDSSTSSTSVTVSVQAGQEDISAAVLRVAAIGSSGLPDQDAELRLNSTDYVTDSEGNAEVVVTSNAMTLFQLVTRGADSDRNQAGTRARCQWVTGCANDVEFGAAVTPASYEWRSVAYDLARDERIRVTPLTELAAALAFGYVYAESPKGRRDNSTLDPEWQATGFYSPYAIEQAISQVSKLFGIQNVQTSEPADLTQLNEWAGAAAVAARDSIRYGALLAAWAHLEETTPGFTESAVGEFLTNKGQIREQGGTESLTLHILYTAARNNLNELAITNAVVQGYVQDVITELDQQLANFTNGGLSNVAPESLANLFGSSGFSNFQLGIQRSKAFMDELRNNVAGNSGTGASTDTFFRQFFNDGYKDELDSYADLLQSIGDQHNDNLTLLIEAFRDTQILYLDTVIGNTGDQCAANGYASLSALACAYDSATRVMTLTGSDNTVTVTQAVADVNTTDSDSSPSTSQAIDVLIRGTYQINGLRFDVDHVYNNGNAADGILSPSGVRVYFTDAVGELVDPGANEILAYEIRWSDFSLYDSTTEDSATETEVTGSFRMLLRGVKNPLNSADPRRFNIDDLVLNSRISDVIGDDSEQDESFTTFYVAARSSNVRNYYPEQEFAGFTGFFNPQAAVPAGTSKVGIVSYALGTETVRGQVVEYFDFLVPDAESRRYRFYPTIKRADVLDIDKDGDRDELIDSHDLEICTLSSVDSSRVVSGCNPSQRLYTARDRQLAVNDLWEAGVFSRVTIPAEGEYFVSWPATDVNGCYELNELSESASLNGELSKPMMMGLDTLRVTTDVQLQDQPRTFLDVLVTARSTDRYTLTAALSHDFTSLNSGTVFTGSGIGLDRLIVSVDTDSALRASGNVSIYKSGVALVLDEESTSTLDSEFIASARDVYGLNPLPFRYVTGKDGGYDLCVVDNAALASTQPQLEDQVFSLTFRGVVYGSIRNENGIWIVRYLDGSFETL